MRKNFNFFCVIVFFFSFSKAQESTAFELAKNYLNNQAQKIGLNQLDLQDLTIENYYKDEKRKTEHLYLQQNIGGYPIFNALANFTIRDGKVLKMQQTLQTNVIQRIENQNSISDLNQIATLIATNLNLSLNENAFLNSNFHNFLSYFPTENGKLNLSWAIHLNTKLENEIQIVEVIANAQSGEIYHQHNQLLSCDFHNNSFSNPITERKESENIKWLTKQYASNQAQDEISTYRVYKLPVEAPTFGERELINSPADSEGSPYGWHDTDGADGPEYTHTQGNNVIAVNDQDSEGLSWLYNGGTYTFNGFAEGGSELEFDFPLDFNQNLYNSPDASTTNLFYMNNMMHDIWYKYGFTEEVGNFQVNNYGNGGTASDEVYAFGQTGESIGSMNNAMFGTPSDGGNPYMVMFMWDNGDSSGSLFTITTSGDLQGNYDGEKAGFGGALPEPPLVQNLALLVDEGGADSNDGCENVTNSSQLNGKIVFIRRGTCNFDDKILRAQNAGAEAVVMVNNVAGAPIVMGGDDPNVTIPSVMISQEDGEAIISALQANTNLEGSIPSDDYVDGYKDGSLDNGIIAHEYGHGISTRLTGPPSNSGCLWTQEQMGEGWSDYFALVMTMHPGDEGTDGRGIGTYAISEPTTGTGLRPTKYSTDMSINPSTYDRIKTAAVPHGVGYVWATMLWEMTWQLIGEYGFDPDLYNGTGGNNLAMQLVIDGLKLQPCGPGFIDGRDAILEADELYNEAANQCFIWNAFAKRGLGYSATQGSANNTQDGVEAFDMPPVDILNCDGILSTNDVQGFELSIYPNPTKDEFYILTEKSYGNSSVSISDLTGKNIFQTEVNLANQRATINVSSLPVGIYVVTIQLDEGKITKKLIKK